MNYKEYFINNKIDSIELFLDYAKNEFKYGWMDKDNKFHEGCNDADSYRLQSPAELIKSKMGICWDMTELNRCWFTTMTDYRIETYYIFYDDDAGCPSHSIIVYYKDDSVFWFEPMFDDEEFYYSGIHEYSSLKELLNDAKKAFLKNRILQNSIPSNYDDTKIYIYKYDKPNFHINGHEVREHIDNSYLINL